MTSRDTRHATSWLLRLRCLACLIAGFLAWSGADAYAGPVPPEKQALIKELLQIGKEETWQSGEIQLKAMMKPLAPIFSLAFENFDAAGMDIVSEELMLAIRAQEDVIEQKTIEVYADKFSAEELRDVLDFYRTPTGAKVMRLQPEITEEAARFGMEVGQRTVQAKMPEIFEILTRAGYVPRQKKKN